MQISMDYPHKFDETDFVDVIHSISREFNSDDSRVYYYVNSESNVAAVMDFMDFCSEYNPKIVS